MPSFSTAGRKICLEKSHGRIHGICFGSIYSWGENQEISEVLGNELESLILFS